MNKRGQLDILHIIVGILLIAGGVAVMFSYVNLGIFLASIGMILGLVKLLFNKGALS